MSQVLEDSHCAGSPAHFVGLVVQGPSMPSLFLPDELHAELCHHHKRPRSLQVTLLSSLMSDGGPHEWDPRHTPEGFNKQKSGRLNLYGPQRCPGRNGMHEVEAAK